MAPWFVWFFIITVCVYNWGLLGGIAGGLAGFALLYLFGMALSKLSGGILSRRERDYIATTVLTSSKEILEKMYPDLNSFEQKLKIEEILEEIAREALIIYGTGFDSRSPEQFLAAIESLRSKGSLDFHRQVLLGEIYDTLTLP